MKIRNSEMGGKIESFFTLFTLMILFVKSEKEWVHSVEIEQIYSQIFREINCSVTFLVKFQEKELVKMEREREIAALKRQHELFKI